MLDGLIMMKTFRRITPSVAVASSVLTIGTMLNGLGVPRSFAQEAAAKPLIGQCRAANKRTPIYVSRDPVSEVVILLERDNTVILAENTASSGMIAVNQPKPGFVSAVNLKQCSGKPAPPPVSENPAPPKAGACRQVVPSLGLIVRNDAASTAAIVGSLAAKQKVTLVEPPESRKLGDGRIWIRLAAPIKGWVSDGLATEQVRNLGPCN
jgi:hypothetical protein